MVESLSSGIVYCWQERRLCLLLLLDSHWQDQIILSVITLYEKKKVINKNTCIRTCIGSETFLGVWLSLYYCLHSLFLFR